jgi:hypothetical protein
MFDKAGATISSHDAEQLLPHLGPAALATIKPQTSQKLLSGDLCSLIKGTNMGFKLGRSFRFAVSVERDVCFLARGGARINVWTSRTDGRRTKVLSAWQDAENGWVHIEISTGS